MASALLAMLAACEAKNAAVTHAMGEKLARERPECPQRWDTIPLFPVVGTEGNARATGGTAAAQTVVGATALARAHPITDIPEFHDCQKFIADDGMKYDSLFAIFAVHDLNTVGRLLVPEALAWTSSNPKVATVSPSGVATGIGSGTTSITGVPIRDSSKKVSIQVTVSPALAAISKDTINFFIDADGPSRIAVGQSVFIHAALGAPTTRIESVAEIYTYGPGYGALGIGPNFNCLYIYFDDRWKLAAKMVKKPDLGPSATACVGAVDPKKAVGDTLDVRAKQGVPFNLPSVARWDFDSRNRRHYIGIRCGDAWCEVGRRGFQPSSEITPGNGGIPGQGRVLGHKGWYDQQFLAVLDATTGEARPSKLKGTVVPHPDLRTRALTDYDSTFLTVAFVGFENDADDPAALAHYKGKFNFDPAPVTQLKGMNKLDLCHGTTAECKMPAPPAGTKCAGTTGTAGRRWWVRLVAAKDGSFKYRCVTRREHTEQTNPKLPPGFRIPNTARWRWLLADETVWDECTQGCCETEAGGVSPIWGI